MLSRSPTNNKVIGIINRYKDCLFPYTSILGEKATVRKLFDLFPQQLIRPVSALLAMLLIGLCFAPVFSGTIVKSVPVAFASQTVQDPTIELGNNVTRQTGADGEKQMTFSEPKSLFNLIFGGGEQSKLAEKKSIIIRQPVQEVINAGTKKYQYMYCSNGSYRYYTDTQLENPNTGFTHKSPDYCAQNHQGAETQLADVPPRANVSHPPSAALTPISLLSLPNCITTSIPYGIDYQNVSWLPVGQTETYPGLNGTYFSCLGTTVQPLNEIIYTGTGQNYDALAQQEAQNLAREKCTQQYNSAIAQIDALGAGTSSAAVEIQQAYQQCLSAAG